MALLSKSATKSRFFSQNSFALALLAFSALVFSNHLFPSKTPVYQYFRSLPNLQGFRGPSSSFLTEFSNTEQLPIKTEDGDNQPIKTKGRDNEPIETEHGNNQPIKIEQRDNQPIITEHGDNHSIKTEYGDNQPIKIEETLEKPIKVAGTSDQAIMTRKNEEKILRVAKKVNASESRNADHNDKAENLDSKKPSVFFGGNEKDGKIDYVFGKTVETENGPIRIKHVPHDEKMQIQEAVQNSNRTIPLYPWKAICDERDDEYNKALHIFVMTVPHEPHE